jgi:signal transduction histidine kinase
MHRLALAYARLPAPGGSGQAVLPALDEEHVEHDGTVVVQFWSGDGRLIASSWPIPGLTLQAAEGFRTLMIDGHYWRVYTELSAPLRVQVVQSGDFRRRVILDSALDSMGPIAFLIPASIALLWLAVFLALRPVDRLVQAIARQDERNLGELPLHKVPRELLPLMVSMNGLLARLKEAFAAQQRFVQDAAHELRTPLTALKLQVENLHQKPGGPVEQEIARLEAGIQRMQRLVEQLLKLARQEAAQPEEGRAAVDLQEILKQSINDLIPLAERRNIDLGLKDSGLAQVYADANDLRGVFDNLLDNALRYTPTGGSVDVSLRRSEDGVIVEFLDTGPGIPPALLERVFDRFYRVLGTGTQGSGLGLAIARSAAGRGGFQIELLNRADRAGLVARVRFPRAA